MKGYTFNLRECFDDFNGRYFRGRLPRNTRVIWSDLDDIGCLGLYQPDCEILARRVRGPNKGELRKVYTRPHTIKIDRRMKFAPCLWMKVLIHEQVHLKLELSHGYAGHGPLFQREMKKLAKIGAFNRLW